eukprot:m.58971 g.58971  ORF g.58971 m.58971 type:complete len:77 (+) comp11208_c0_seq3:642-872(+)
MIYWLLFFFCFYFCNSFMESALVTRVFFDYWVSCIQRLHWHDLTLRRNLPCGGGLGGVGSPCFGLSQDVTFVSVFQ